jgi:transcriptional regulator with XRE-family HTH domain
MLFILGLSVIGYGVDIMNDEERRKNLAEFLRTKRSLLKPEDVGLHSGSRRRTPGLRREEVALLANISASWYTALEQGRDVHPSEEMLEGLVKALLLTPTERHHLYLLAKQPLLCSFALREELNPALVSWIYTLNSQPAYIIGRRWDLLAWNLAAEQVFNFSIDIPPHSENFIWRFFFNEDLQKDQNWEMTAKQLLTQFRNDSAYYPNDPSFIELINNLLEKNAEFSKWWGDYDFTEKFEGIKTLHHSSLGKLEFEQITLQVPTNPDIRVVILNGTSIQHN